MSITLLGCILLNNWMPALSQTTRLYVSIGDEVRDSKIEIAALEKLKIGGQWQVFDLVDKQYLGEAKVTENFQFECVLAKGDSQGSTLINNRQFPPKNSLSPRLLIVKRVPFITSKVDISQVIFAKLPDSLKSILNRRNSGDIGKEIFYAVDIDSDSSSDIIVAISSMVIRYGLPDEYIEVFVKSNYEWNSRGRYSGWHGCR